MGSGASKNNKKSETPNPKKNGKKSVVKPVGDQTFSYEEMKELIDNKSKGLSTDITVIDVRSPEEVKASGIIPTAVEFPLGDIEEGLELTPEAFQEKFNFPKPGPEDHLVLYCLRGMRTQKAATIFKAKGYTKVDTFPGSWIEWSEKAKK